MKRRFNIYMHFAALAMVVLGACSKSATDSTGVKKTWLQTFMERELDSLELKSLEGTKITMVTDGNGESNDNGQGLETQKFEQLDYRAEMDGILEYSRINIEDASKYDRWVDSSINRQGLWMRITHYNAKDTMQGLQAVEIYELEYKSGGWTVYPPLSALGAANDSVNALKVQGATSSKNRQYLCYLVTWDFKQRSWWMDRDVRAYYQKGAQAFGYKIRENSAWGSPKGVDVQVNLNNELWLNND